MHYNHRIQHTPYHIFCEWKELSSWNSSKQNTQATHRPHLNEDVNRYIRVHAWRDIFTLPNDILFFCLFVSFFFVWAIHLFSRCNYKYWRVNGFYGKIGFDCTCVFLCLGVYSTSIKWIENKLSIYHPNTLVIFERSMNEPWISWLKTILWQKQLTTHFIFNIRNL